MSLFRSEHPDRVELTWRSYEGGREHWACPTCQRVGGWTEPGKTDLTCKNCQAVFKVVLGDVVTEPWPARYGYIRVKPVVGCDLTARRCAACNSRTSPLPYSQVVEYLRLVPRWTLVNGSVWENRNYAISRDYLFEAFAPALAFVDRVGALAEQEGHHPDILLHEWRKVRLTLKTHAADGLTENDFIVAAKIDALQ